MATPVFPEAKEYDIAPPRIYALTFTKEEFQEMLDDMFDIKTNGLSDAELATIEEGIQNVLANHIAKMIVNNEFDEVIKKELASYLAGSDDEELEMKLGFL